MCSGSSRDVKRPVERTPASMGMFRNSYFPMKPKEYSEDKFRRDEYQSWKHKMMKSQRNIQGLDIPIPGGSRAFLCPASALAQDQEVQDAHLRPQSGQCQPKPVPQQLNIQMYRSEAGDLP
ncbi:uncharacterized protein FFB14_08832 [Fusarium fujikuroi]|nr:uncharacterized protein FFB14_08832 [Fusarium fujikuroi]